MLSCNINYFWMELYRQLFLICIDLFCDFVCDDKDWTAFYMNDFRCMTCALWMLSVHNMQFNNRCVKLNFNRHAERCSDYNVNKIDWLHSMMNMFAQHEIHHSINLSCCSKEKFLQTLVGIAKIRIIHHCNVMWINWPRWNKCESNMMHDQNIIHWNFSVTHKLNNKNKNKNQSDAMKSMYLK